jgi:hypothetical protein
MLLKENGKERRGGIEIKVGRRRGAIQMEKEEARGSRK